MSLSSSATNAAALEEMSAVFDGELQPLGSGSRRRIPGRRARRATWKCLFLRVFGGPCRDRTYDQEIKSLLLYQLS